MTILCQHIVVCLISPHYGPYLKCSLNVKPCPVKKAGIYSCQVNIME